MDKKRFYFKTLLPFLKFLYIFGLLVILTPHLGIAREDLHGITAKSMRPLQRLVNFSFRRNLDS